MKSSQIALRRVFGADTELPCKPLLRSFVNGQPTAALVKHHHELMLQSAQTRVVLGQNGRFLAGQAAGCLERGDGIVCIAGPHRWKGVAVEQLQKLNRQFDVFASAWRSCDVDGFALCNGTFFDLATHRLDFCEINATHELAKHPRR